MRRRLAAEVVIVLAISLGQSAVYALVNLLDRVTREVPLAEQVATLNPSRSNRELLDLVYQLLGIGFSMVPVALVIYLLWSSRRPRLGRLGIDARHPWRDAAVGAGLAAVIGAAGIGVYLGGRALGVTVAVDPAGLTSTWWTIPVLLLSAARAGIEEEVIMIGYLVTRLRQLGWQPWTIILVSAVIRGTYHLYQGFGAFVGTALLGVVFGWLYIAGPAWIRGRTMPLVIAHFLIDAVAFVGYPVAAAAWPGLFGMPGAGG